MLSQSAAANVHRIIVIANVYGNHWVVVCVHTEGEHEISYFDSLASTLTDRMVDECRAVKM